MDFDDSWADPPTDNRLLAGPASDAAFGERLAKLARSSTSPQPAPRTSQGTGDFFFSQKLPKKAKREEPDAPDFFLGNLQAKPELNGKQVRLRRWDGQRQRWAVRLLETGAELWAKPENLTGRDYDEGEDLAKGARHEP